LTPIHKSRDLAHKQSAVWPLTQDEALFWQITRFMLIAEPRKFKVNRQIGVSNFKYVRNICPYIIIHVTCYGTCTVATNIVSGGL